MTRVQARVYYKEKEEYNNVPNCVSDIIEFPFDWMRKLTILPTVENYNKYLSWAWPVFGIPYILWAFFRTPTMNWLKYGLAPAICFLLFLIITQRNSGKSQIPSYFVLLSVLSTISGLIWTFIVSSLLIDLLTMVGVIAKLNTTYLGLTILAMGNALPDALCTIALAKDGYA